MWNLVGAYYHGTNWYASSMMTAVEPWSGNYWVAPVVWATAHVTQFTQPGWLYLKDKHGSGSLPNGGFYVRTREVERGRERSRERKEGEVDGEKANEREVVHTQSKAHTDTHRHTHTDTHTHTQTHTHRHTHTHTNTTTQHNLHTTHTNKLSED